MNPYFDFINYRFGFGCMRLPMKDGEVDTDEFSKMIEYYFSQGFNYFDTAHGYLGGKSELAIKACLTSKYPRDKYILTDKLTAAFFKKEEDIRPFFESQLEACGVDYFDFYLMHAQGKENYPQFKACRAYETAFKLKEEGKIRHVGISFHDTADVLEMILSENPGIECVQIQFNYLDYDDPAVQSGKLLEVCKKYNKPVIVMEPVKGGHLVNLPLEAKKVLDELKGGSYASYALRFAEGFDQMMMVLSGMSNLEQMKDNLSAMKDFKPLSEEEKAAIDKVVDVLRQQHNISCTGCRYCVTENHCPKGINIPDLFACYNIKKIFNDWNQDYYYNVVYTTDNNKASACIKCGMCEKVCPQHLTIRKYLEDTAALFETKK